MNLFHNFFKNIGQCFKSYNLLEHLVAIVATYFLVISGFDWQWFSFFHGTLMYRVLFSAVILGGILPILFPVILYEIGRWKRNEILVETAFAVGQAEIIALLISSFYKAVTGRIAPELFSSSAIIDMSHKFQFGFLRGGVFWGWPSSHTANAFAMATALITLFPKNKAIFYLALLYAFYIGLGVSVSIHWFSDVVAGAIIGSIIGTTVGKSYQELLH